MPHLETSASASPTRLKLFAWLHDATRAERKSLFAGGLGWMLDAMDVMLYSLVLTYLIREFAMDTRTAGLLNSLTLIASAIGGFLFGVLADRIGHKSPNGVDPRLLHRERRLRVLPHGPATRRLPLCPRPRNGR
jgi:hypothetical protein